MPVKRTALGRFKHEGAESIVNHDGRVVIYMGDDQRHDYVYKFVTLNAYLESNPEHNRNLLDQGTLHVAKFEDDGSVQWMPLEFGTRPLTEDNDFHSQADVLIETRRAADLLGATKMDRPEDVQPNPKSGKVYISLTNNTNRSPKQINRANPRAPNYAGHIIEITPHDNDHASTRATWDMLVLCGNPDNPQSGATFNSRTSDDGWFAMPDNFAVDHRGRLWVVTDGNKPEITGRTDGIWALQTHGTLRGTSKHFVQGPIGAEVCGPTFTPDDQTLFASIQHPGAGSSFDQPSTRWPDFDPDMPPRPAVIAITRIGGGKIA
jgi:secreted PhoX family phosphatase